MDRFRDLPFQEQRFKDGIRQLKTQEQERLLSALTLATKAHDGQLRDEGDPFIIHPIRIANTLIYDLKCNDVELIVAGLLHDVVEDSDTSIEEISDKFGERVGELVIALTRDKNKETKREKFEKDINGPPDVRFIKTCDWLDNLRSLPFHLQRDERWLRLRNEGKEMYVPLAEATGNEWLVSEMKKAYLVVSQSGSNIVQ